MDHAGMEIDRVDLERFRAGLPPLERKWIKVGPPVTVKEITKEVLAVFSEQLAKQPKKVK